MSAPTPSQALLLFGLLARHGACGQAELVPAVKKADREALVKAKLIAAAKMGRGLYLTLEDAGWAWAGGHLPTELPPAQQTLQDLLARLGEHLAKSGETLAEFIGSKPDEAPRPGESKPKSPASRPRRATGAGGKAAPKPSAPTDTKQIILKAYAEITGGRTGTDVPLSALRAKLPRLDRTAVDAALTEMHLQTGNARLMRIEHTRVLTDADHQAALHFKGNVFHALWIEA